jgi:hypothetical protein
MVGSHSPPWTSGGTDIRAPGRGGALVGVGTLATLRHESSPVRAKGEERGTGIPLRPSLGLGRQCGGRAMGRKWRWRRNSMVALLQLRERGKMRGGGAVRVGRASPFYRGGKVVRARR